MSLLKLKQKFTYENFLVLGCGPSLNDFTEYQIDKINGNIGSGLGMRTIVIKQALFHYPNADIHFQNTCNISDYRDIYIKYDIHSIFQIAYPEFPFYDITKFDTIFPIIFVNDFHNSLSYRKDLDEWRLDKSKNRCWGPGGIYETVFYLCQYLGAKNIYTIGWDLGTNNSGRDHFYDDSIKIVNQAQPLEPKETEMEVELSRLFYEWLKSKGCNLFVASKNSNAHVSIPRIQL